MKRNIDELISGYFDESLSEGEQSELSEWIRPDWPSRGEWAMDVRLDGLGRACSLGRWLWRLNQ